MTFQKQRNLQKKTLSSTEAARIYLYKLLARRDYAVAECRQRLHSKGFVGADCEQLLDEFCEQNFLSDQRFAAARTQTRIACGYAKAYIAAELRSFEIDASITETVLEQVDDAVILAKMLTEKKRRQPSFYLRRGFSSALVYKLLKTLSQPCIESLSLEPQNDHFYQCDS